MGRMLRSVLRRKYLSLGCGELAAAAVFTFVAITAVTPRMDDQNDVLALWSALTPLLVILVQGGIYWLLARGWVGQCPMPGSLAALYLIFRVVDAALLLVGLVGVVVWLPDSIGLTIFVALVWLFGLVEFINYFVIRLAYPVPRWPNMVTQRRIPRLAQDVRDARTSVLSGSTSDTFDSRRSSRLRNQADNVL